MTEDLLGASAAELVGLAESAPGLEVCGLVLGGPGAPEVIPLRNAAEDPAYGFLLEPRELLAVLRRAEREERAVAALFHSHPSGGAALSAKDVEGLTIAGRPALPGVELWTIGLTAGRAIELRAFRWADGRFLEVRRLRRPFTP